MTFDDKYRLSVGSQVLELSYHGNAHVPGNIFIYAPKQRTLMVVDVIFPGWMPWRRFAVAQDIPALLRTGEGDQQHGTSTRSSAGTLRAPAPTRTSDATRVHRGSQGGRRDCPEDDEAW